MKRIALVSSVLAVTMTGACVDRTGFETEPAVVKTELGDVTCQLYTADLVMWDRHIVRPKGMNAAIADEICYQEGLRQKEALALAG
jgi:hypothetical protein